LSYRGICPEAYR